MKIKITLIAFFASVLVLTSCMKNEVSPGIEAVRSAYAAYLNAVAQAQLINANANAELVRAQAAVQNANAELTLANAAGIDAATAQALENLAQAIEMNKVALAAAQRTEQALLDAYNAGVAAANNTLVANYYANYVAALTAVNTLNDQILDKHEQIRLLQLDLINGTDAGLTAANNALAAAQAELAALEAELVEAQAILGDPAAITAKLAELVNDSVQLEVLIATLAIDMQNEAPNFAAEATAEAAKLALYNTAKAATVTAKANLANAEANFLADTVGTYPVPDFWQAALDSVANTNARLTAGAADTLASYAALKAATDLIALGVSDIDALIQGATDSTALYTDSIQMAVADTLAKLAAHTAAVAAEAAAKADTAALNDAIQTYVDSNMVIKARWVANTPSAQATLDSTKFAAWSLDSLISTAELTIAENTTVPNAIVATANALTAFNTSIAYYNANVPGWTAMNAALAVNIAGYTAQKVGRLAAIAAAQDALPDLQSDYLYHQTFMADLLAAVDLAEAYKEAVRLDYETWKAEYYDAYVANLQAIVDAKVAAEATAKATWQTASAALTAAKAQWTIYNNAQIQAIADLATVKIFQGLYGVVDGINTNFVLAFENAIAAKEATIPALQAAVVAAQAVYQTGLVNYDKFNEDLADLAAKLAAAQAQVDFWKALLDEALANAS